MKMKSRRQIDRDRMRRDARQRARVATATRGDRDDKGNHDGKGDDDSEIAVARSLLGYDA